MSNQPLNGKNQFSILSAHKHKHTQAHTNTHRHHHRHRQNVADCLGEKQLPFWLHKMLRIKWDVRRFGCAAVGSVCDCANIKRTVTECILHPKPISPAQHMCADSHSMMMMCVCVSVCVAWLHIVQTEIVIELILYAFLISFALFPLSSARCSLRRHQSHRSTTYLDLCAGTFSRSHTNAHPAERHWDVFA